MDHKIATWRFRHVQMVEKMLGQKIGTGGSSGQEYLKQTVTEDKYDKKENVLKDKQIKALIFDDILINTSTFQVSSSLNSGTIRLGSSVTAITSTTNTGVYMDGTGKFRVGESTNGDNFIYFDGTTTQIKSTNFDITGTNLKLEASSERAGEMWLGTIQAPNDSSGVGFYASSSGVVRIFADSSNYMTFGGSSLDIKTGTFDLDATTLIMDSAGDSGTGTIRAVFGKYDGTNYGMRVWDGTNTFVRLTSAGS